MKNFDASHYLISSANLSYSVSYFSTHLNIPGINTEISAWQRACVSSNIAATLKGSRATEGCHASACSPLRYMVRTALE